MLFGQKDTTWAHARKIFTHEPVMHRIRSYDVTIQNRNRLQAVSNKLVNSGLTIDKVKAVNASAARLLQWVQEVVAEYHGM